MELLLFAAFSVAMVYFAVRAFAAFLSVHESGIAHSEELLRNNVTFGALWRGNLAEMKAGTLVQAREGLFMEVNKGSLTVEGTRTIARDVF